MFLDEKSWRMDRLARSMERLLNSRRTSATACTYPSLTYLAYKHVLGGLESPPLRHTLAVCFPRYVFPRSNHRRPLPCCSYTLCKQLISEAFRRDISSQVESFFPFSLKEFRYMNSRILDYSKTRIKRTLDIFEKRINFKEKF